jgi:hypothetical protein
MGIDGALLPVEVGSVADTEDAEAFAVTKEK